MLKFSEWLANKEKELAEVGTGTNAVARFTMPIGISNDRKAPPSDWSEDDDDEKPKKKSKKKS